MSRPRPPGASRNVLLLFLTAALVATIWTWRRPAELSGWRDNLDHATAEARVAGKPMLLYFTADWCAPCRQMRRTTWVDPRVVEALIDYVPVTIDVDRQRDLAQQYEIDSIPCLVLIDRGGRAVASRVGFVPADAMVEWLESRRPSDP